MRGSTPLRDEQVRLIGQHALMMNPPANHDGWAVCRCDLAARIRAMNDAVCHELASVLRDEAEAEAG